MEAVRNTNSPLNGLRCSSPIVNGLKDEEKTVIDRKNKGTKRKRSSSETPFPGGENTETPPPPGGENTETPPPPGGENTETPPPPGGENTETPPPGGGNIQENSEPKIKVVPKEGKPQIDILEQSSLDSDKSTFESEENTSEKNVSLQCTRTDEANLSKRLKTENDGEAEIVCDSKQKLTKSDECTVENTSSYLALSCQEGTKNLDHDDVRWEGKDFSQQTEDFTDTSEDQRDISSLPLDIEDNANGINGRFGEDGNWYAWSETMPCNEGNLIILPYVLLE